MGSRRSSGTVDLHGEIEPQGGGRRLHERDVAGYDEIRLPRARRELDAGVRSDPRGLARSDDDARNVHRARLHLYFDESLISKPAKPELGLLVGFALANCGKGLLFAHVVGAVVGSRAEHLHDMPAVAGLEGLADLVR